MSVITIQEITSVRRPHNWGAYGIVPVRIDFLVFSNARFHDRTLYEQVDGQRSVKKLQP
ncbi:pyridoxine 5'-phosphate oxidase C-terminal domain-containing protein [Chitinophaga sp. 22536]|uniref:pyridoxine 5'-phosphate oxidase C-terminal domain-containing protein n=1 Tax=unclassified Chitinophaga TaxID=2619133 RepID=UPI003F862764